VRRAQRLQRRSRALQIGRRLLVRSFRLRLRPIRDPVFVCFCNAIIRDA
jgi:hypothetical protein